MKKKLQKEISEMALKLAKLETEFDVQKAKQAIRHLYEKLTILEYLEGQLEDGSQSFDSKSFREKNWFTEPVPVPRPEHEEALVEPMMEKIKDLVAQMPHESRKVDELLEEIISKKKLVKNDLEEFAADYQEMPVFERKEEFSASGTAGEKDAKTRSDKTDQITADPDRPRSLNEVVNKGLNIGLNDRLAFIKQLFHNNADDYARVLSQINTMESYDQAATFIEDKVKPDYNDWSNKDEYVERFMLAIEKRFN